MTFLSRKRTKNVSKTIQKGTTLQTRDEYFYGQGSYRKPGYENKGLYRRVVVVDSNRQDDLAVVKLGTSSGKHIPGYQKGKSRYVPIVLTKDDKGKPVRVGSHFWKNGANKKMSNRDVQSIKRDLFKGKHKKSNRGRLRELKGRK